MNRREQQRRRRIPVTEWNHDQCPVGVDEMLDDRNNDVPFIPDALQSSELVSSNNNNDNNHDSSSNNAQDDSSPTQSPTTEREADHHFSPSDRKLGDSNWSPFLKARDLFFHHGIAANQTPIRRSLQQDTLEQANRQTMRFGHSTRPDWSSGNDIARHNADYNMGLISIPICFLALVLGWLILLAILSKLVSRKQNRNGHSDSLRDANTTFESTEDGESPRKSTAARENLEEQDEDEESKWIHMECASAASPRWLSFPENKALNNSSLKSVASYFTNTPSESNNNHNRSNNNNHLSHEDASPSMLQNNDTSLNTTMTSAGTNNCQYYRVGVVRDGKVDVSCDETSDHNNNNNNSSMSSRKLPWNEILGGLFADMVTCDEDLKNVSFGSSAMGSAKSGFSKSTFGASTTQDEILRDLEELEQQVNNSSSSAEDLQSLREIASYNPNHNNSSSLNSSSSSALDASAISSLLTTAMQQKNQENLLQEEGVEIWYDVESKTFFRIDHNQGPSGDRNYVQFDPAASSANGVAKTKQQDESIASVGGQSVSNKKSFLDAFSWSGAIFRYRSLAGPSSESVSESDAQSRKNAKQSSQMPKSKAQLKHRGNSQQHGTQGVWFRLGAIAFFASGLGILVSSFSMALFGANTLAEAANKASYFVGDTQALAMEGTLLIDNFLESSSAFSGPSFTNTSGTNSNTEGAMFDIFSNLTQQLYKSTNSYCDFANQDARVDEALNVIEDIWVDHMAVSLEEYNAMDRDILNGLEGLQSDLSSVSETTASLEETWIRPYNIVILVLRVGNSLLCFSTLLLLIGAAQNNLGHAKYRWIILPLYTLLVAMSLVACLFFLVGSTALQDFCVAGPDEQILEFLSFSTQQREELPLANAINEVEPPWADILEGEDNIGIGGEVDEEVEQEMVEEEMWSTLSYDMAKDYIQQCPSGGMEGAPEGVATMVEHGWEFARALWEVSVLLTNTGTCVNERTPALADDSDKSPIFEMGELVMETSCHFSVLLTGFVDVFRCDNWYRLYEEGFHNAACDSGRSGFLWGATTQSIIVVLSLVMLTIRIIAGSQDENYYIENNEDSPTGGNGGANESREKTLLIEDEDDFRDSLPSPNDPTGFLRSLSFCQFIDEKPKQTPAANPRDPHGRSSERMLRRNPKKKPKNNFLSSTALYSIGGATFEAAHEHDLEYSDDDYDEDDENVEVRLYPGKIVDPFEQDENRWHSFDENRWRSFNCLADRKRSESTSTKNIPQKPKPQANESKPNPKYSSETAGWSEAMNFSSSSDDFNVEVDRVRERLKNIEKRKDRKVQQRKKSAPEFQITVTTQ